MVVLSLLIALVSIVFGYILGKREFSGILKNKLWDMRLTKDQVNKNTDRAYGYTDCINDLCDWIYKNKNNYIYTIWNKKITR